ncbi:PucR C-terminal helix-turn-helix domain-containing protein [Geodermatophilus pulveris]|uniref:PucR C-terminal helix-turn-helix domain-containing protein n=1 Tax=Geodermatophilus pulveris TaxID=1564159 RepID=A0A239FQE5_9ACTN|nr:helix-turn-helix domain-containing protein [Geodermatophilus pulveris]SNS59040.1 PucR C-terminal helix-turn-helix domain-containing protein [Geodermatophilus pulveris]
MAPEQDTFPPEVAAAMLAELPAVAEQTVAAIVVEVPSYTEAFTGPMGRRIESAVQLALGGFLELASGGVDPSRPVGPALEEAFKLGRGEARTGRPMDALLAAYRVGARVAWRHMSETAVAAGMPAGALARFAELVFAYIDQLSAASASGHADQLDTSGRLRRRHLERLADLLLTGAPPYDLTSAAERADWTPPRTLTAVLVPEARVRGALGVLDGRTLQAGEDLPGAESGGERVVLLVPDAEGYARTQLVRALTGREAVIGPTRPWQQARTSYSRALRAVQLDLQPDGDLPVDTELRLADLVLRADGEALADLRAQVLGPLDGLGPGPREKLVETLRSWLLHHGRRERVAAELFVHPQTVRYRMGQLRELYGNRLEDPRSVLELTLALALATP